MLLVCIILGVAFLLAQGSGRNPLAVAVGLPILGMSAYIFIGGALGLVQ